MNSTGQSAAHNTQPHRPNRPLRSLLAYAKPHRWMLALVLLLTLAGSAAGLVQPLIVESVVANLAADEGLREQILLLAGLFVASIVLTAWQAWLSERTAERVVFDVRQGLIGRLIRLKVAELDQREPGSLTTRVTSDSTVVQHAATTGVIELINGGLHLLASIVLMGVLSLPLLGMTILVLIVTGVALGFVVPKMRRVVQTMQESVGEIGAALDRALGAIRTVKANSAEPKETQRAVEAAHTAYRAGLTGARYISIISVLSGMAVQVSFLAVIGFGGALVATGSQSVATLIAFLLYLFNLGTPILSLVTGISALQQGLGAMQRIDEVKEMAVESDIDSDVPNRTISIPSITIDQVAFSYAGRTPALNGASFTAEAGQMTAIVGASGAGKTTLFSLLQRFYDYDKGRILLDNDEITHLTRAEVRNRIAYVEQDNPMLAGTVRENLVYAAPDAHSTDVADVLTRAGLDELVQGLPQGLDTPVGARGIALSGGERQRLAIARALLRRPQVLLLDEVTAHLDAQSEQALRHTIDNAARECTVLLIAHRLSTVISASQLVLMEGGRVRATGTHSDLMSSDPIYRKLANSQLQIAEIDPESELACDSPVAAPSTTPSTVS